MKSIWIPVVGGIMKQEGRVLVGQRPAWGSLPGLWEFPGGKMEQGETSVMCLERELYEELDIQVKAGKILFSVTQEVSSDKCILILFYNVKSWSGVPRPQHHTELRWVTLDELKTMDIPDSNKGILDSLAQEVF